MTIDTKMLIDEAYIRAFSTENSEPEWLTELRVQALLKSEELSLPKPDKTRIKNWNFTEFSKHGAAGNAINSLDDLPEAAKAAINVEHENKNLYIQHNQTAAFLSLSEDLKAQGVIFTDIITAAKEHGDLVQKYFMKDAVKVDEHKLTAYHAALMNGGVFLYVPKNVEVKEPIQAIYISDDKEAAMFNHVIVVADDNSSVTFVENYLSTHKEVDGVVNIISEVFANNNAKVVFGAVDTLPEGSTVYVNRRGVTGRDAQLDWALGMMNDGNTIFENITNLMGDGSN